MVHVTMEASTEQELCQMYIRSVFRAASHLCTEACHQLEK